MKQPLGLLAASVLAILVAAIAAGWGGYVAGVGDLEVLQLRVQTVERGLRDLQDEDAVRHSVEPNPGTGQWPGHQPPNLHYVPPEE